MQLLANSTHPLVEKTAARLTNGLTNRHHKLESIFNYVRDDIQFQFPPEGDFVTASQTIERGYGQCNTKGVLILALCQAAKIPARLHFSRISKEIQRGFFKGLFYKLMPQELTHSWLEVHLEGRWVAIDTYINDLALHKAAVRKLKHMGWNTGYSISRVGGEPSADFNVNVSKYSQMGAVVGDDGSWSEPAEFFQGPDYLNRPNVIERLLYRLYIPLVNRRVRRLRRS